MIKAKIASLEAELEYYGYRIINSQVISLDGSIVDSIDMFNLRLCSLEKDQVCLLKKSWKNIELNVKAIAGGIGVGGLRVLQKCISRLIRKTKNNILLLSESCSYLNKISSRAADIMSHATAEQAAVVLSTIELYEYNIKKLAYLRYIVNLHQKLTTESGVKIATDVALNSSIQGPYSNLDLPIQERVFTWGDISEDVSNRQDLKQKQRRYRLGLEDNAPSDTKVGFYWRELRNEPYLMPSGSAEAGYETSYPYRANLWGNP